MDLKSSFQKTFLLALLTVLLLGCKNDKKKTENITEPTDKENFVEVVTTGMNFEIPGELKSGWTTFKYINKSEETHFFIFEKMPTGITIENYLTEIVPPFKAAFTFLLDYNVDSAMKEFEKIPDWWSEVEMGGGVGLISPHSSAESTIYMNPGTYVMECYVRMPNGMPHAFYGMLKEIIVTEESNENQRPSADHQISISSEKGISFLDSLKVGDYKLAVNFQDQKQYETLLGHDVNLVKLENEQLLDTLNNWINAANIKAFRTPVPAGLTFLGGVEDLEAGATGYFNVSLNEGAYVLISEIPNAIERKMFKTFKVYK